MRHEVIEGESHCLWCGAQVYDEVLALRPGERCTVRERAEAEAAEARHHLLWDRDFGLNYREFGTIF